MADHDTSGRTVLLAEDALAIAHELETVLREAGYEVVGPIPRLDRLTAEIGRPGFHADAAVLDVDLRGEDVFPAVDLLAKRRIPVILTTGFDTAHIPDAYRGLLRLEKPVHIDELLATLERLLPSA